MPHPKTQDEPHRRLLVIRNPEAGRRHGQIFDDTLRTLEASGCTIGLVETAKRGDAEALASTATRTNFDLVVAAGGDGTIAEVINGLARRDGETLEDRPGLAVVPLGTANVLAHELELPFQATQLAGIIARGPLRALSLGRVVDGPFFGAMAGAGFDAQVVANVNLGLKRVIGKGAYVWQSLCHWFDAQPRLHVTVDGVTCEVAGVVVSKGRFYGGRFVLAPKARIDGDILQICLFDSGGPWRRLVYALALSRGRLSALADFRIVPGRSVTIDGPQGAPLQGDGDIIAQLPVEIELVEKAIRVAVPLSAGREPRVTTQVQEPSAS